MRNMLADVITIEKLDLQSQTNGPALVLVARHSSTAGLSNGGGDNSRMAMMVKIPPKTSRGMANPSMTRRLCVQ